MYSNNRNVVMNIYSITIIIIIFVIILLILLLQDALDEVIDKKVDCTAPDEIQVRLIFITIYMRQDCVCVCVCTSGR